MKRLFLWASAGIMAFLMPQQMQACTGITLFTQDGLPVTARTIEWAGNDLESRYTIVPRGFRQRSFTPDGQQDGMSFTAKYGYVGLAVQQAEFVVEGLNEVGLAAGLFYFPQYGEYEAYDASRKESTVSDLQLVSWILGSCRNVDEVKAALRKVHVVTIDPRGSTVHWRFTEEGGRQVVLEIIGKEMRFYENTLGVLTNSPSFDWHLTHLNNYVNMKAGPVLRGRVGRGKEQSYCIFMQGQEVQETKERLKILVKSNDGFKIAGEDLRLRGPGDLFGIRQSGLMEFALADIYQDADILKEASEAAGSLLKLDPDLTLEQNQMLREKLWAYAKERMELPGL